MKGTAQRTAEDFLQGLRELSPLDAPTNDAGGLRIDPGDSRAPDQPRWLGARSLSREPAPPLLDECTGTCAHADATDFSASQA